MNEILRELIEECDINNYIIENINMNIPIAIVRGKNNARIVLKYDDRENEWYWD